MKEKGVKKVLVEVDEDYKDVDIWELYSDQFQIHWVDGVATEVEVFGKLFKATLQTKK